jgi:DNA repair protein RecN (Recombination protein N)
MLTDLIIKNIAIIEQLHVSFGAGFNVLTGETGAGKSIIIDSVNLLLGGRARGEAIRTGTDEASVEAIFDLSEIPQLRARLEEMDLAEGNELIIRRIISRGGKNRVFINSTPVPVAQLRDLAQGLVNIYGQHDQQSLQRPEAHLGLLDHFSGASGELSDYRSVFSEYKRLQQELADLDLAERTRQQRLDMLQFQQQELAAAELRAEEEQELERERSILQHAEKLTAATQGGYDLLYGGQAAVSEILAQVAGKLENLQGIDPQLIPLAETLRSSQYALEDVSTELRDYSDRLDFEPQRQQQVEERLALIALLKRKYAPSIDGLLEYLAQISVELETLGDVEGQRKRLDAALAEAKTRLFAAGAALSGKRRQGMETLAAAVERELAGLAMPKAKFSLPFEVLSEPAPYGLERGEFYLAANPGEEAQPLAKIASGGELSRIMLALRRSAPQGDAVRTLIFDEVDAGIGGEAATAVGEKICRLGREVQVLCVTHLPQVAAFADQHYRVLKEERGGRTATQLICLDSEQRTQEMARMLGGTRVGEQTLVHARELIASSQSLINE